MLKRIITIHFLIGLLFFSCGEDTKMKLDNPISSHNTSVKTKKAEDKKDEIIYYPCAVFTSPSDHEIDSLKKNYSEEDFSTIADDNMYYVATARDFLSSKKVRIIDRDTKTIVKFRKSDGKISEINLSGFLWGIILFNGEEEPIEADMTMIQGEYERYMK